jgi:hypothetical protein
MRVMSINNTNHLISGKNSGSMLVDSISPGKKKEMVSKLQQYKNYAAVNIND